MHDTMNKRREIPLESNMIQHSSLKLNEVMLNIIDQVIKAGTAKSE